MPTVESADSVSPLQLQVKGSAAENNAACSCVKGGEHMESWSSSLVQGETDWEAIG